MYFSLLFGSNVSFPSQGLVKSVLSHLLLKGFVKGPYFTTLAKKLQLFKKPKKLLFSTLLSRVYIFCSYDNSLSDSSFELLDMQIM